MAERASKTPLLKGSKNMNNFTGAMDRKSKNSSDSSNGDLLKVKKRGSGSNPRKESMTMVVEYLDDEAGG